MNDALIAYTRILRARWRWLVWSVLVSLAAATVVLILLPPMYQSDATVFIRTPGDVSRVGDGGDTYARERATTYAQLATSTTLADRVATNLGLDVEPSTLSARVKAKNPPGTALIDVAVSAPSASQAQQTATMFLSEYTLMVRQLESIPGQLIPRAELVVVDPPSQPTRTTAWGVPLPMLFAGVALIGLFAGITTVIIREAISGEYTKQSEKVGV